MRGKVRPAAVAGSFYPGSASELRANLAELTAAPRSAGQVRTTPKAVIAPHAGYIYSGPIAASAFAALAGAAETIRRVILLGPAHRYPIHGLALPIADSFETPLGVVEVDQEALMAVAELPQVTICDAAHNGEHSLEVGLPFLQFLLSDFKILPLVVGTARAEEVAEVLERVWGGPETCIVISSDLSHYLPCHVAKAVDQSTADDILALGGPLSHEQACGATPINGLILAARLHGLKAELLDLRNSGDTAGDQRQVVGYAAFAFNPS
jgi:AmmeMemoRadiSam system protein B